MILGLEKGMTTHSTILAWRIPWTEEPGGLQSMGPQRIRYNLAINTWLLVVSHKTTAQLSKSGDFTGTSLVVQQLKLHDFNASDMGLIPGWGPKIPHAVRHGPKKKIRRFPMAVIPSSNSQAVFTCHRLSLYRLYSISPSSRIQSRLWHCIQESLDSTP